MEPLGSTLNSLGQFEVSIGLNLRDAQEEMRKEDIKSASNSIYLAEAYVRGLSENQYTPVLPEETLLDLLRKFRAVESELNNKKNKTIVVGRVNSIWNVLKPYFRNNNCSVVFYDVDKDNA